MGVPPPGAIRTTIIGLSVIHPRTSRVYIILIERDSVEGRCMQMSVLCDAFKISQFRFFTYCGGFVRHRVTAF